MPRPQESGPQPTRQDARLPFERPKLTYITPRLVEYGEIDRLTQAIGQPNSTPTTEGFFGEFDPS